MMGEHAQADCKMLSNWQKERKSERKKKEEREGEKEKNKKTEKERIAKERCLFLLYMPSLGTLKTIKEDSCSLARELDI